MLPTQTVIHVLFVSHFRFLSPAVVLSVFLWRHMKNLFEAAGEMAGRRKTEILGNQRDGIIGKFQQVGRRMTLFLKNVLLNRYSLRLGESVRQIPAADADGRGDIADTDIFPQIFRDIVLTLIHINVLASLFFCLPDFLCKSDPAPDSQAL